MSRQRLTPYKPTIIHDNCKNYNSGYSSTLILDLKLFIVEQLTQLSDKPWANRIQPATPSNPARDYPPENVVH